MDARFTYAAVYQVEAVCRTPLRTGGVDGDPERVLRRRDGAAFIQGSSLAGALRGWLVSESEPSMAEALFGSQGQTGHIIVTDGVFQEDADQQTRPRLRIDNAAAVGDNGGKFDVAHMARGSKLRFSLIWMGKPGGKAELAMVERMLSAVDAGAIRLGAQKSNGFGQLSLTVNRRVFDMMDPSDREAWLADRWEGEAISLPRLEQTREVSFTVTGQADKILVKTAPVSADRESGNGAYTPNLSEGGRALLPASSVRGAVRARAEYISRVLGLQAAFIDRYFGRGARDGDNGLPGLVRFEDGELLGEKKKISRIHIDRFTGGVQRGGLFTEEPISADLTLRLTAPEEPALCGLLLYALRDLGLGLYNLGSGWAIGRGLVAVEEIRAIMQDGESVVLRFDGQGGIIRDDPCGLADRWMTALEEARHEH